MKDTGKPEDLLEANQLVLQDLERKNEGTGEESATIHGKVSIGRGTIIHCRTTIRGPPIVGDHCTLGPNTYIGPYTSIGDTVTIRNTEMENSIIMKGAHIDRGRRIVGSLIRREVKILGVEQKPQKATGSSWETWPQSPYKHPPPIARISLF